MNEHALLVRADKKLEGVHLSIVYKAKQLIQLAHKEGIFIIITQGLRTNQEQDALFEQGRTRPGKIVTNARGGYSYHNYGLAFDICVCDIIGGKLVPNWFVDSRWKRVGEIGKSLGLEWGGDWTSFVDFSHFQLTFTLSIGQLRNGIRPLLENNVAAKYRIMTGTFNNKQEVEMAAEQLRRTFGWLVYIKKE